MHDQYLEATKRLPWPVSEDPWFGSHTPKILDPKICAWIWKPIYNAL
jgi:hypothetical protein